MNERGTKKKDSLVRSGALSACMTLVLWKTCAPIGNRLIFEHNNRK